jgi:hypothetical protein
MVSTMTDIFADITFYQLSGLLGLALFFLLAGIREIRTDCSEGYLYLTVAVFLAVAHAVVLENALSCDPRPPALTGMNLWHWLVVLAAPALIVLFVLRSIFSFIALDGREGLIKLFFGLTLLCYLYLVGADWPADVRGLLTVVWIGFFFKTEMAITD